MLGRHVYRVRPNATGGWSVQKDGESGTRGDRSSRADAVTWAAELATADEPSRLVIEDGHGAITEERSFGTDSADAIADDTPLADRPARR
jgi:hypothetical protein